MSSETSLNFSLDGAPMGKERVRFVKATGRTFTPERTVNYESRLALAAQQAMAGRPLLEGPLGLQLTAKMPIPASKPKRFQEAARRGAERPVKKPDWDNFGKILDALNLVVWHDDAQVVEGHVSKVYSDRPSLEVRVWQIGGVFG
jgi:Holliday junction resolvase RusA-like endonuclease